MRGGTWRRLSAGACKLRACATLCVLIAAACHRAPAVPVNTLLLRMDAPWMEPAAGRQIRTAPATILSLRASGEFAELHCWLIEQPDETLYVASRTPRVAAIGTWKRHGDDVEVTRTQIARTVPLNAAVDPLCSASPLLFSISGNSIVGNAGSTSTGGYAPVTRLVAPEYESYVTEARRSSTVCPPRS